MRTDTYYQSCLKEELSLRIKKNPRYSLRAFAQFLDINPSTLSRVLKGEKRLSIDLSKKIAAKLELNPKELKKFIISIAESYEDSSVKRKKTDVKEILKKPKEKPVMRDLSLEVFKIISDWYHYAILQLAETGNCKSDHAWIARRFGINEMEAKFAVERLVELEMIAIENGNLIRTTEQLTDGDPTLTTSAHRKRIRQISEKSTFSLENDPISIRNHRTTTMAIDPELLPVAREMIQDFMDELGHVLQAKKKKVYELQINLFPLERSSK